MGRACVVAIALLLLAGCGSADEEKAIRATLAAYERAWNEQSPERACTFLTEAAQRTAFCAQPDDDGDDVTYGGEPIVSYVVKPNPITGIEVDGDRAELRHERGGPSHMRKVDGRWLLDAG